MNAFHIIGACTALYAVLLTIVGVRSEDFPSGRAEKVVAALSILLVVSAISAAIITSANEADESSGVEGAAKSESQ